MKQERNIDLSPFLYGTTVSSFAFTNREADQQKLRSNLLSGINTMLISPRRWGKSSLVEKVATDIRAQEPKVKVAMIDFFSASSEAEFLELFAKEIIKASSTRWEDWMASGKNFFKNIIPSLSIGIDPSTDFNISFDWKDLQKNSDEVLNLPETIAKAKGVRMIVCLDEFQNLSSFGSYAALEKKMRSLWQRHKHTSYCLYGSKRHMMADIFNNPSKPFYRFGDIIMLQKIEKEKWVDFICSNFSRTKKKIAPELASAIAETMKNHSWYVQQLSHFCWNMTVKEATKEIVNSALHELIAANTPLYQREIEAISATQINLLKAVVKGETKFTSTSVMQKYALGTPRNVSKNKTILINADIIQNQGDAYEFVDPAFELWFRKQFYNWSYQINM